MKNQLTVTVQDVDTTNLSNYLLDVGRCLQRSKIGYNPLVMLDDMSPTKKPNYRRTTIKLMFDTKSDSVRFLMNWQDIDQFIE